MIACELIEGVKVAAFFVFFVIVVLGGVSMVVVFMRQTVISECYGLMSLWWVFSHSHNGLYLEERVCV